MARQGAHQVAQKSTSTGVWESRTSALNVASVAGTVSLDMSGTVTRRLRLCSAVRASPVSVLGRSGKVPPVKLFLPEKTLEEWALSEKADLVEGKLVVKETNSSHPVIPGVAFSKTVSGDDTQGLVGRVKTSTQLAALGAEHLQDSVILGDTAYEVVPGYVAEVAVPVTAKQDAKKKATSPEADLLAAFILDKL